jgi:hypothetical protein
MGRLVVRDRQPLRRVLAPLRGGPVEPAWFARDDVRPFLLMVVRVVGDVVRRRPRSLGPGARTRRPSEED